MIDFDELDDADSAKTGFVARLDYAGTPRGECSCCDCLEWLSPYAVNAQSFAAQARKKHKPHPYNVTRRLEANGDGRRGSSLSVFATSADPARTQDSNVFAVDSFSCSSEYCEHCGCHAMWHEDVSDRMAQLNARGMLVEAQPGWSDVERALFFQTGGAFQPGLEAFSPGSQAGRGACKDAAKSSMEEVLVSVVCPTSVERRKFHPSLYHCFNQQRHAAKELIVVETGTNTGSSLCFTAGAAANDPRVIYRYFDDSASPWSIGTKRNIACYLASGAVIVHFDDDDLYTPGYLGLMVRALQVGGGGCPDPGVQARLAEAPGQGEPRAGEPPVRAELEEGGPLGSMEYAEPHAGAGGASTATGAVASAVTGSAGVSLEAFIEASHGLDDNPNPPLRGSCDRFHGEAVTFSAWFTFNAATGGFGICDVDNDHNSRQAWTLGYGFTFAYLRDAWSAHWFRDVNLGEDCDFFEALLARGARVVLLRDCTGFCAHTHHEANFSPWEKDREVPSDLVSSTLREMAAKLGSNLKIAKQRMNSERVAEKAKAVTLTPTTAAALQDELIAEYTKEKFQRRLHLSWWQNRDDLNKQMRDRSLICLEVQGPILERYGFPNSMEGVRLSTCCFTPEINAVPNVSKKNFLIHWLCKPEMQASTPIDQDALRDMVQNLTKNAKVRRRRS